MIVAVSPIQDNGALIAREESLFSKPKYGAIEFVIRNIRRFFALHIYMSLIL